MVTLQEILSWLSVNYDWFSIFVIIFLFTIISIRYFRNKQDKNREPLILLLIAVLLGMVSVVPSIFLSIILLFFVPENISAVIVAPIAEEIGKGLFVGFIARSRLVRNTMDGLIYGAMVGIGFAAVENFLYAYVALTSDGFASGLILASARSAFQIIGHPLYTGITGYGIGLYKQNKHDRKYNKIWFAMLLHALWNSTSVFYVEYWIIIFPGVIILSIIIMRIVISRAITGS